MLELGLLFLIVHLLFKQGRHTFEVVGLAWRHLWSFMKTTLMVTIFLLIMALSHC